MKTYVTIPAGLLILIFVFKITCSSYFSPTTSGLSGLIRNDSVNYIFIGSSQTRQGLSPKILEDSLGDSYILAYNGNSFFFIDYLLKVIIEKKIRAKKLIVEAYPYRALDNIRLSDTRIFTESTTKGKIELLRMLRPYVSNWQLYNLVINEGNENIATYPFTGKFINSLSYKGGYIGKQVKGVSQTRFNSFKPPHSDSLVYHGLNKNQIQSVKSIILLCRNYNLELVFFEPVVPVSISHSKLFKMAHDDLKRLVEENGSGYISSEDYHFDNNSTYYSDPVHLSTLGRNIFTKKIIKFVR